MDLNAPQGHIALAAAVISMVIVLSLMFAGFRHEKKIQASNDDEH